MKELGSEFYLRQDLDQIPYVDAGQIAGKYTKGSSNNLISNLRWADVVVIGSPIYNFGVPAKLKTWADQVARAGVTFKYTLNGPIGLLENKKAYVAIASGGTRVDSEIDFATPWLRQFLKFIGIDDVKVIFADQLNKDQEFSLANMHSQISAHFNAA